MHILMDLDDVIIHSSHKDVAGNNVFYWVEDIEKRYAITTEQISMLSDGWMEVATGKKTLQEHVKEFLNKIQSDVSVDDFIFAWVNYKNELNKEVKDWVELMQSKGHDLYIATAQENIRVNSILKQYPDFFKCFKKVFTSADIGFDKNQEQFFKSVLDILCVPANEVVLIDDNINNISIAQCAGVKGIQYIPDSKLPIL